MSSSTKIDNRKKDILILGKDPTQGLEHTLSAENFPQIAALKGIKHKIMLKLLDISETKHLTHTIYWRTKRD